MNDNDEVINSNALSLGFWNGNKEHLSIFDKSHITGGHSCIYASAKPARQRAAEITRTFKEFDAIKSGQERALQAVKLLRSWEREQPIVGGSYEKPKRSTFRNKAWEHRAFEMWGRIIVDELYITHEQPDDRDNIRPGQDRQSHLDRFIKQNDFVPNYWNGLCLAWLGHIGSITNPKAPLIKRISSIWDSAVTAESEGDGAVGSFNQGHASDWNTQIPLLFGRQSVDDLGIGILRSLARAAELFQDYSEAYKRLECLADGEVWDEPTSAGPRLGPGPSTSTTRPTGELAEHTNSARAVCTCICTCGAGQIGPLDRGRKRKRTVLEGHVVSTALTTWMQESQPERSLSASERYLLKSIEGAYQRMLDEGYPMVSGKRSALCGLGVPDLERWRRNDYAKIEESGKVSFIRESAVPENVNLPNQRIWQWHGLKTTLFLPKLERLPASIMTHIEACAVACREVSSKDGSIWENVDSFPDAYTASSTHQRRIYHITPAEDLSSSDDDGRRHGIANAIEAEDEDVTEVEDDASTALYDIQRILQWLEAADGERIAHRNNCMIYDSDGHKWQLRSEAIAQAVGPRLLKAAFVSPACGLTTLLSGDGATRSAEQCRFPLSDEILDCLRALQGRLEHAHGTHKKFIDSLALEGWDSLINRLRLSLNPSAYDYTIAAYLSLDGGLEIDAVADDPNRRRLTSCVITRPNNYEIHLHSLQGQLATVLNGVVAMSVLDVTKTGLWHTRMLFANDSVILQPGTSYIVLYFTYSILAMTKVYIARFIPQLVAAWQEQRKEASGSGGLWQMIPGTLPGPIDQTAGMIHLMAVISVSLAHRADIRESTDLLDAPLMIGTAIDSVLAHVKAVNPAGPAVRIERFKQAVSGLVSLRNGIGKPRDP